jgi:GDP-D-mannose 3',5'-epimerase
MKMNKQKTALVLGAGGFIGNHLVNRLKDEGYWVRGVDLKYPEYQEKSKADDFQIADLSKDRYNYVYHIGAYTWVEDQVSPIHEYIPFDEVYQLAADMGGAGYIFSGNNDANVMTNSAKINLNCCKIVSDLIEKHRKGIVRSVDTPNTKVFYSSSACMYPAYNQEDPDNPNCSEDSAYPAAPDSEYGWEKLFSERLYLAYHRNYGLDVRIARFHNIFGPLGTWRGGKEKAPAAMCRKVLESDGEIEIWGDGNQTRSFLYIDECIEGIRRLMNSDFTGPVNIGSEECISINELVDLTCSFEKKKLTKKHIPGPLGVRGRNSDNTLIEEKLGWAPDYPLIYGLEKTYFWIKEQLESK